MKSTRSVKKRLLAIPEELFFMQRDLAILRRHFEVRTVSERRNRPRLIRQFMLVISIFRGTLWADVTFTWFAGGNALIAVSLSRLLRKKSVVVVGGYEVARVPEIGHGAMLSPLWSRVTRHVLKNADKVLAVDESLREEAISNAGVAGHNIDVVPTGYDADIWQPGGEKEDLVLTVATIAKEVVRLKGLETFVKAAASLPHLKFALVGPHVDDSTDRLRSIASSNVEFPGAVANEELPAWYGRAKVYCQLSRYEGLPNALCEAMLCECVPVGTRHNGIPLAIGDTGFYVPYGDVEATVEAVRSAAASDTSKAARERIKNLFPLERRERELVMAIGALLEN